MILSASQIESFDNATTFGCQAKWWFEHPGGLRGPKDAALTVGDATHQTLETFLLGGPQGGLHDIVIGAPGALEWLIQLRKRVLEVEVVFKPEKWHAPMKRHLPGIRIGGIDVQGKIDWIAHGQLGRVNLGDHKTTSNIAKYGKTKGQIKTSVQMNVYAKWMFEHFPGAADELDVTQDFYQSKRGKKFLVESTTISKRENDSSIDSIEATVETMVKASVLPAPDTLTPNLKACDIGYGCSHRAYCPHYRSGVFDMASLFEAFAPPASTTVAVLPPDAPASNPAMEAGKLRIQDLSTPTPPSAPLKVPEVVVEPLPPIEVHRLPLPNVEITIPADKAKRGRKPGSQNKPKNPPNMVPSDTVNPPEMMNMMASVPSLPSAGPIKINKITIRHGAKIGMPNYSSAEVMVELEAEVTGSSVEEARSALSLNVHSMMRKELAVYQPKGPVTP